MTNELQLSTPAYNITRVGLDIQRHTTVDEWRQYGDALRAVDEAKQWAIGDWLVDGKSHYNDGLYEEASQLLGEDDNYLRKLKSMADRFPLCTRVHNVTHKHYTQVSSVKKLEEKNGNLKFSKEYDIDKQQAMLENAEKEKLTVMELQVAVKKHKEHQQQAINLANAPEKYDLVYADPPWQYDHPISDSRKIENHYPTMLLADICKLKVPAGDNAVLILWSPSSMVHHALDVIKSWGFDYRTTMVWVKPSIGPGQWVRARHEMLFIAIKGDIQTPAGADKPDSVMEFPRREHSQKPDEVYDIIEAMFPELRKIELFARNEREGWASWGDQQTSI